MIGYYVHHVGQGHAQRAKAILGAVQEDATILSSLPSQNSVKWVTLTRDDTPLVTPSQDPTAHSRLHWAPVDHPGYSARMLEISNWISTANPRAMVVDVSVEVTVMARILGIPVIVVALPGDRTDAAHQLAFDLADQIIAAWPEGLAENRALERFQRKVHYVGGISRFDPKETISIHPPRTRGQRPGKKKVLVLLGGSDDGFAGPEALAAAQGQTPGWEWSVVGGTNHWVTDVSDFLASADVVVSQAGQNSVADIAAFNKPAIIIPQERPYGEQWATGAALRQAGLATVLNRWPSNWAGLLDARLAAPLRWEKWRVARAAERAARVVDSVACRSTAI